MLEKENARKVKKQCQIAVLNETDPKGTVFLGKLQKTRERIWGSTAAVVWVRERSRAFL